jgi:hypothetical protein
LEIEIPNDLVNYLKRYLAKYDLPVQMLESYGPNRARGDIHILWQYS